MRTWMTAIIVAVMVLVPLGIMGTASAAGTTRDLTTVVIGPVPTDRFDGVDPERPLERDRRRRDLRELHSLRDEPDLRPGGEQHVRGRWQVEPDRVHVPPDGEHA